MNKTIRKIVIAVIALITIVSVSGITPATAQTITPVTAPAFNFTRSLTIGSTGEDVRALQQFLNTRNFIIAITGAGSPGNETTRFGPRTQVALARFQVANNISPARGFFGPITRGRVMALATPVTPPPVVVTPGVLSSAISPTTPVSAIVPVGTTGRADVALTTIRYTATNEPIILQDITVTQKGVSSRIVFNSIEIVDGTRIIPLPIIPQTGDIIFRDVNIEIPANGHRDITVRADLAGIGPTVAIGTVISGQTVGIDVNVTRARGKDSNTNITTGLGSIAGGNLMTIRRTVPTVTTSAATLGVRASGDGNFDHEVLRFNVTADASGDVFLREISVFVRSTRPTIITPRGISVFQGTAERGRIMNLGTTGLNQDLSSHLLIGVGEARKYQVGQKIRARIGNIDRFSIIESKTIDTIVVDPFIGMMIFTGAKLNSIHPHGFASGRVYRIPLTGAFIPRGTTSSFSVFTDSNDTERGNLQLEILPDVPFDLTTVLATGLWGNFVWGDSIDGHNINGHLITGLPITGPALAIPF